MKYPNWKLSHKFMGLAFIIGVMHSFLVPSDITKYPTLMCYMSIIVWIGLLSFAYASLLKPVIKPKTLKCIVESVEKKGSLHTIILYPKKERMNFEAGQFAFIRFKDIDNEQHPFTIAAHPSQQKLRFVIKNLGDYTSRLDNLKEGSEAEIEGPYGQFYKDKNAENQIWIAGGIGITPFLSMAKELKKKATLYYCTKNHDEAIFVNELSETKNLAIINWCSDERGTIKAENIIYTDKNVHVWICGPPKMMEALSTQLIKKGVKKNNIHMEEFNIK